jgi:hypothetical protein
VSLKMGLMVGGCIEDQSWVAINGTIGGCLHMFKDVWLTMGPVKGGCIGGQRCVAANGTKGVWLLMAPKVGGC